jgi:hypothetical protein
MSDNLPALIDYSKALAGSDLLPAEYRNKPANVLVAIEYGKALGLEPMSAIQGITVIKGKPTASAALMAGLVRRAGHILRVTGDDKRAECIIIRQDDPDFEFKTVWTIDRAIKAGLTSNQTWTKYPDAMLKARAISECARNACSEILAGVQYTSEELGEGDTNEPVAVTARRTTPVTTKATTSRVPKAERPQIAEPDFDEPAKAEPEPEPQAEIVDAEIVEEPQLELVAEPTPEEPIVGDITAAQLKHLHASLNSMGVKDRTQGLHMLGRIIGREITSTKELSKAEAAKLIDALQDEPETDE